LPRGRTERTIPYQQDMVSPRPTGSGHEGGPELAHRLDRRVVELDDGVGRRAHDLDVIAAAQSTMHHVKAERPVDLELLLAEELVAGRFVREPAVAPRIVAD